MNKDDVKARCGQWLRENGLVEYNEYTQEELHTGLNEALEAFARALVVRGMEEAIKEVNQFYDESRDRDVVFYECLLTAVDRLKAEIQRIKEGA
jgi:hypothetical protein